jgi:hypothetical protein
MGISTVLVVTCDKCGKGIPTPEDVKFTVIVGFPSDFPVPHPDRTIACSAPCAAALMTDNANALLNPPAPPPGA